MPQLGISVPDLDPRVRTDPLGTWCSQSRRDVRCHQLCLGQPADHQAPDTPRLRSLFPQAKLVLLFDVSHNTCEQEVHPVCGGIASCRRPSGTLASRCSSVAAWAHGRRSWPALAGNLRSVSVERPNCHYIGQGSYTTADGSEHGTSLYQLDTLTVGGLTVTNVECLISTSEAGQQTSLFGLRFLRNFRSWSIDNARNVLLLEKW